MRGWLGPPLLLVAGVPWVNGKSEAEPRLVTVRGAGASLAARMYQEVGLAYKFWSSDSVEYESIGSGAGVRAMLGEDKDRLLDFAGSDKVLTAEEYKAAPDLQMYPSTATAVVPIFNVPGVDELILTRDTVAQIFLGEIREWDDPRLLVRNPWLADSFFHNNETTREIIVVTRSDGSGTTEIFTKALSSFYEPFNQTIGASCVPEWEQNGQATYLKAAQNDGVVAAVLGTKYSIGYSVLIEAERQFLTHAKVVNKAGSVIEASKSTVQYAAAEVSGKLLENPQLWVDMVDGASSTAWPISGLTYFVLRTKTSLRGGCAERQATLDFLMWYYTATTPSAIRQRLGFCDLPPVITRVVKERLAEDIYCPDGSKASSDYQTTKKALVVVPAFAKRLFYAYNDAYRQVDPLIEFYTHGYRASELKTWLPDVSSLSNAFDFYTDDSVPVLRATRIDSTEDIDTNYKTLAPSTATAPLFVAGIAPLYHLEGVVRRVVENTGNDNNDTRRRLHDVDGEDHVPLILSIEIIARCYAGDITSWNHPDIAALNPGVLLPETPVVPVFRGRSCGSTLVWTRGLSRVRPDLFDPDPFLPPPTDDYELIAWSDLQAASLVQYKNGALGYATSIGLALKPNEVEIPHIIKGLTHHHTDEEELTDDSILTLSADSLAKCQENAAVSVGDTVTTFDLEKTADEPGCWPFAANVDVSLDLADVDELCAAHSDLVAYMSWLFSTEDLILEPMRALGVAPSSAKVRDDFYHLLNSDCHGHSHHTRLGVAQVVAIVMGCVCAVLVLICAASFNQRRHIRRQRRHITDMRTEIEDFKASAVAMRSVAVDFVVSDRAELKKPPTKHAHGGADKKSRTSRFDADSSKHSLLSLAVTGPSQRNTGAAKACDFNRPGCAGPSVVWYWAEDPPRVGAHDATLRKGRWVRYAGAVAADLEVAFLDYRRRQSTFLGSLNRKAKHKNPDSTVVIDVAGRVVTTGTEAKAFHARTGTTYEIDFARMTQTNMATGHVRPVLRETLDSALPSSSSSSAGVPCSAQAAASGCSEKNAPPRGRPGVFRGWLARLFGGWNSAGPLLPTTTQQSLGGATQQAQRLGAKEGHASADDIEVGVDPHDLRPPADLDAGEPFLILRAGALVQVTKQRPDGWAFGSVVLEPAEALSRPEEALEGDDDGGLTDDDDDAGSCTTSGSRSRPGMSGTCDDDGSSSSAASPHGGSTTSLDSSTLGDTSNNTRQQQNVLTLSEVTGWFPISLTEQPRRDAIWRLAQKMGDNASRALACPDTWTQLRDPLMAEFFRLDPASREWGRVVDPFLATLQNPENVEILAVDRVQNVSMWQSYAVKRRTVLERERFHNNDSHGLSRIERFPLFHGTRQDIVRKIVQQGFNRSFAGRNATVYGKGVYFARDASYSSSKRFAVPNAAGVQFVFCCRVLVGEYCVGKRDAFTPDLRDPDAQVLYDTTVDTLDNPSIFVTYHDAQAYPEYLVQFRQLDHVVNA